MPKLKTHKGAKDRIKVTGGGKLMRSKGMKTHLRRNKSKDVRKQLDSMLPLSPSDETRIRRLLPYGVK